MRAVIISTLVAVFMAAAAFLVPSATCAQGNCGYKPIKPYLPVGCKDLVAVCVCDSEGKNCRWQWTCVK